MAPDPVEKPEPENKPKVTNMTDYQGREKRKRDKDAPEKKIEKVVVGEVVVGKKTFGRKAKEAVVEADFKSVADYLMWDWFIPLVKHSIVEGIINTAETMFFGERSRRTRRNIMRPSERESRVTLYPYNQHHRGRERGAIEARSREVGSRREVESRSSDGLYYILPNRDEATRVLDEMQEIIELQGYVTVADLKELLGVESLPHTDNKYGWRSMRGIKDFQSREGYVIDFPPPEQV